MKDVYSISSLLDKIDNEILEEKYPEEFTIKHKIFLTWYNIKK